MVKTAVASLSLLTCAVCRAETADDVWNVSLCLPTASAAKTASGWTVEADGCRIETAIETDAQGVDLRRTTVKNVSAARVVATALADRFWLEDGDYEVYTQVNTWQHESEGGWQPLRTAVSASNGGGLRSCQGAAPVLAVWNRNKVRGRVYHLMSDGAWRMTAERRVTGTEETKILVEVGYESARLAYPLAPGESVALPEIISYEFANRTDLDCHKLHAWWNARYPSKGIPAIYNSWLYRFERLTADGILSQVPKAKELGFDYFVIDAGWFGPKANWVHTRGDWEERADGALSGRMAEISEAVRAAGMKFGFWLEAEAAGKDTHVIKDHPDWFIKDGDLWFLDFENPKAYAYLLETTCALVKKYKASFIKFDFNQDRRADPSGRAFVPYNAAYRRFLRDVRARNPGIYLEGCASGGYMTDLGWAREFDGFWPTDNQSAYEGLRIAKETLIRLPPRLIERWVSAVSLKGVLPMKAKEGEWLMTTTDAWWCGAERMAPTLVDIFTAGGPICFTCDLTTYSDETFAHFKKTIAERRAEDAFWSKAVVRVIADTPKLTVIEYSDETLAEVRLVYFTHDPRQAKIWVHPALTSGIAYDVDGEKVSAETLAREGVMVWGGRGGIGVRRLKK